MVTCSVNVKDFSADYVRTAVKELNVVGCGRGGKFKSHNLFALLITVKNRGIESGRGKVQAITFHQVLD